MYCHLNCLISLCLKQRHQFEKLFLILIARIPNVVGTSVVSLKKPYEVSEIAGLILVIADRPTRVLPNVEVAPKAGGISASVGWRF